MEMQENRHTYKSYNVLYPISRFCRTKAKFWAKKGAEEKGGLFHWGLKPCCMKSRVNGLLRETRRGRKREEAGKPDSQWEGDWTREEMWEPERMQGKGEQGGMKRVKIIIIIWPQTISAPRTEHHLSLLKERKVNKWVRYERKMQEKHENLRTQVCLMMMQIKELQLEKILVPW